MSADENLVIDKEARIVSFIIDIDHETFEGALDRAYQKRKNNINIQGFRKGKAPRKIIESIYGKEIFYDDAVNDVLPDEYQKAAEKFLNGNDEQDEIETVGNPEFELVSISDDEGVKLRAKLVLRPEGEIDNYKGLEYVEAADIGLNEEDINKIIEEERNKNARIMTVERPIEMGDMVNLNCQGYVDGKAFAAGKAENYDLVIGSKTFIDTFEEQLIGASAGDDVEVNVVFPEKYHVEELSSKPALFKVKINRVSKRELPELDDDFAQEVSEFDSFEEYKNDIKNKLEERNKQAKKDEELNQLLDILAKNVVVDIPKVMLDAVKENMLNNFERNLQNRGLNLKSYLTYANKTREALLESYNDEAEKQLKIRLALEAIVRKENIIVTDEDMENEIKKLISQTGMSRERLEGLLNDQERKNMKKDIAVQKAADFVHENAIAIKAKKDESSEGVGNIESESDQETVDSDEDENIVEKDGVEKMQGEINKEIESAENNE